MVKVLGHVFLFSCFGCLFFWPCMVSDILDAYSNHLICHAWLCSWGKNVVILQWLNDEQMIWNFFLENFKFTPFLRTSIYMQIKFESVCPTTLMFIWLRNIDLGIYIIQIFPNISYFAESLGPITTSFQWQVSCLSPNMAFFFLALYIIPVAEVWPITPSPPTLSMCPPCCTGSLLGTWKKYSFQSSGGAL